MAILEKIRTRGAVLLVIAIGLGLLAFIFGDVGNWFSSLSRDSQMDAFIVNGNKVKIQDYEDAVNREMERYKQMNRNLSEAESYQIRDMVYQTMVAKQILNEEAAKLGLTVSPAETFELVQGDNPSPILLQSGLFNNPETGAFDRAALLNFLKIIKERGANEQEQAMIDQYKTMWVSMEDDIRSNRLSEKYSGLIAAAVVANKLEQAYYARANASVNELAYVQQSTAQASDVDVAVTDAETKAYYDEHKQLYVTRNGGAEMDIIYATIAPSEKDFEVARNDIAEADMALKEGQDPALVLEDYSDIKYQDIFFPVGEFNNPIFPSEFPDFLTTASVGDVSPVYDLGKSISVAKLVDKKMAPEMLRVSHIVLAPAGAVEGQPSIDSLLTVLKADPAQFASLATTYSLDRNTSADGGEINWLNEAIAVSYLGEDFSHAIYNATINVPFIFKSQYGEHIVMVTEAKENVQKYKVAFAHRTVTPSNETQTALYNDMSNFVAQNKGAGIDSLALNQGYQVLNDMKVAADQPMVAQGIENSRSLIRWAMSAKPGEVSEITECGDKWVFARLKSSFTDGYIPYQMVKSELTQLLTDKKMVEAMYQQLLEANYSSLTPFADKINSEVDTLQAVKFNTARLSGIGFEPAINGVAGFGQLNRVTPVKGVRSVYLAQVVNREEETSTPEDAMSQLNIERRGAIRSQALGHMIQRAEIKDRRYRFQ